MKLASALLCCCLAWPAARAAEYESGAHPLLDLARALEDTRKREPDADYDAPDLRASEHALQQAQPPADADCARSLGASVFADLHLEVGRARKSIGDFAGAVQAYRRAQSCSPRDARILGNLADALFDSRDIAGARAIIMQALAAHPREVYLNRIAANIEFIEERWADATSRFRYVASSEHDRERASYSQLMYWLAQKRAGVPKPEFVARRHTDGWPRPLLLYMEGQYTEIELISAIRDEDMDNSERRVDQRLCEALYYVGESHWANGDPDLARDYFAAMVNIKVIYFVEHGMALAEIAKLRAR